MHILIAVVALASLVGLVVWSMSQPKEKLQAVWTELSAPFSSKHKDLATPFHAWVETSALMAKEQALQAWLLGLPAEGLQALAEKVAEFCVEMDVELDWLFDAEADVDPNAKVAAEEMVIDYCKICLKAVQNQQVGHE
ncbi:hypothetical protein SAMN05660964_01777 [Thiothrix caldifontis]|uniref:Uncharacterized protein n=1 Tax=Thiothrix caldifontis TaxID=525918 RepID=A0A1H4BXU6_9GAMM|nr:hypothetical protein [Thiothrix caldifontis]SEA52662.1 hypothetical protein SAMN05660964_01777 [Thiothrix caldifontis]